MLQSVEDIIFQQLLVANTNFDRLAWRTVLSIPCLNQRNINGSSRTTGPHVERPGSPQQRNSISSVVRKKRSFLQERLHKFWKLKFFIVLWKRLNHLNKYIQKFRIYCSSLK